MKLNRCYYCGQPVKVGLGDGPAYDLYEVYCSTCLMTGPLKKCAIEAKLAWNSIENRVKARK